MQNRQSYYPRLKDLREDHDLSQADVAKLLGTTQQHYGKYETGKIIIPFDRVIILADYYNVSLDYIAGRIDVQRPLIPKKTVVEYEEVKFKKC